MPNLRKMVAALVMIISLFILQVDDVSATKVDKSLDTFLKDVKGATQSINKARTYLVVNYEALYGGTGEYPNRDQLEKEFNNIYWAGHAKLVKALKSKHSYNYKYYMMLKEINGFSVSTTQHNGKSGVEWTRKWVSDGFEYFGGDYSYAPMSTILQIKYTNGEVDVLTSTVKNNDLQTAASMYLWNAQSGHYGFFTNKYNQVLMFLQQDHLYGGGKTLNMYNVTKKKAEKLDTYISLSQFPTNLQKKINKKDPYRWSICNGVGISCSTNDEKQLYVTKVDEANQAIKIGSKTITLKNMKTSKPSHAAALDKLLTAAKKGAFPNVPITLHSSFRTVEKKYGPFTDVEGGVFYMNGYDFSLTEDEKIESLGVEPSFVGLKDASLQNISSILKVKPVKGDGSAYSITIRTGNYKLVFNAHSLTKPIRYIELYKA